jgi:hypothetical protein
MKREGAGSFVLALYRGAARVTWSGKRRRKL